MARTTPGFRMADRLLKGHLVEVVNAYRDEGIAWDHIAGRLYTDAGVEVSGETLRQWMADVVDASPADEAAS